ncbi:hypothetical protein [Candidatus Nitrosocosmicus hydrocola]|uniref:hypothetical protein n=1 Tax=Candidatus Nitrosocosmicus hydrocola TaxID=1826872 RepID=UPI0011E5B70D|nr:hypothetical protein [Candidatus Nitrosocosmicus hydrocola]
MIDILIFSSSAALGVICAIFLYRFVSIKKHDEPGVLGNVKYELNNLYFEKSVALEALGKIKHFFDDKKIDEYERDRLSRKYIKMLDNYNKRVFQLNPILEAQEIYEYKKQLDSILTEYTKKIDSRLAGMTGYPASDKKRSKVTATRKGSKETAVSSAAASSTIPSSASSVSTPPTPELQTGNGVKRSPRLLALQIKSSIRRITSAPNKLGEDKNKDMLTESSKSIESVSNFDENEGNNSESTTTTTDTTPNNSKEDAREVHQTPPEIEFDYESLSTKAVHQPSDSDKTEKIINIDTKEIDKIQSDILKTLKRLEDS